MESWTRVIVEWVNCLGIVQPSIEDLHDLQNGLFYQKLVSQLSHGNEGTATITSPTASMTTTIVDEPELVSKFIEAEYPEFMASNECGVDIPDELYISSLLLAQCSQTAAFHRPMCVNLKNETQIHIKKFLELVLPYGKSLTRESLGVAIMELGDATPKTPASTPKPSRPLREFFNSPAARSAQSQRFMNDRNRELRYLRAQLETEQFEKTDLLEDLRIQEEKIQNLQKKLNEKSQELKALRNERLKPPTPQSCRKNKRPSDSEERYKRELEQLENVNAELQSEIDRLRDEREELTRRLTSKDRLHTALKQKFDQAERSVETLAIQLERKNNELLDMRMNNEELREHIREIQKSTLGEQSFEMEAIGRARSPMLLNSSEALSSIIDIQLQEAKEESAQLQIQLDATNERLETAIRDRDEMKRLNSVLQEKTAEFETVRNMLDKMKTELHEEKISNKELNEIVTRSKNTCEKLESCLQTKDELLEKSKQHASSLDEELVACRSTITELESSLSSQTSKSSDLESELSRAKEVCESLRATLISTENVLAETGIRKSSLESELAKAEATIRETEDKIENLRTELAEVENEKSQSLVAKLKIEEHAKQADEKIVNLESTISNYKRQIEELNEAKTKEIETSTILRNELSDNKLKLDALSLHLEETEKRENVTASNLEAVEKKVAELMELGEEMESQLAQERELLSEIRAEKKNIEEELSSHVRLVEIANEQIRKLEKELQESRDNFEEQLKVNSVLEKNSAELNNIKMHLEDELTKEQNRLAITSSEKESLEKELASQIQSVANLKELVEKMEKELEESSQNLQQQSAANVDLKNTELELKEIKAQLEDKLTHVQNELAVTLGEKETVDKKLVSYVELSENLKEQMVKIEEELRGVTKNLQERCETIETLEKEKLELNELRCKLESEIQLERQESAAVRTEKAALEEKLTSHVQSAEKLREQLSKIEKELEDANKNLHERFEVVAALEKEKLELNELRCNLESELQVKQQELVNVEADKAALEEKLSSHFQLAEELKERVNKIEKELEESKEHLQERSQAIAALEKDKFELNELKCKVESELQMERQELAAVRAEKAALEDKLSSHVQSAEELKERLSKIEKELEISNKNLQESSEANAALEKDKFELNELKCKVESELQLERQELAAVRVEKETLDDKLSSHVQSAEELKERLSKIEKDFEETQKNLQDQFVANELLEQEKRKLEERSEKLKNELAHERERLTAVQSEKEMLEEEASLYGRSNEDLGVKIVALKGQLDECGKDLQKEREATATLRENLSQLNSMKETLEKQLIEERDQLASVQTQKVSLENELTGFVRAKADMVEEISALHTELESSRKDLQQLQEVNEKLKEKTLEANSRIEILQVFETRSCQLNQELESAKQECAKLSEKIVELTEESRQRADGMKSASMQLEEANREIARLTKKLNEHIQSSDDSVAALEKRLVSSESACAEAKLEQKLKDEALGVLQVKLEQLTKEKVESELRMKEVIVNLQEVRSSQAGVLEAQGTALKEKSTQLEEAEKQLENLTNKLKTLTEEKSRELESEKSKTENIEIEVVHLKETIEEQKKLVQDLQQSLESERNVVKKWNGRCEDLEMSLENVAKVSGSLKLELSELWSFVSQVCPELAAMCEERATSANIADTIQYFADDAKIIRKAIATLGESNDKLKNNIEDIAKVSRSLKLELDALWDSVRKACPELARPKEEISSSEDSLNNSEATEISNVVQSFAEDAKTIRKAVAILSEANETLKDHLDGEKEIVKRSVSEAEKKRTELDERITNMENERKKRDEYLSLLVKRKQDLQQLLSNAVSKRNEVDDELGALTAKWRDVVKEAQNVLTTGSSACDELKHLQIRRTEIDEILAKVNDHHARGLKPLLKALCRIFLWSETKLQEAQILSVAVKNEFSPESELADEQELLKVDISNNDKVHEDLAEASEKIESFSNLLKSYETSLKSGVIKREASNEEKLQAQVEKISKERKEIKDKLDVMRTRNAKLEKNMDALRNENKKLKSEASSVAPADVTEIERLEKLTEKLGKDILKLQMENEELSKNASKDQNEEARLKEVHNEYGLKLEKIKQKMKIAYNEQIAKLNQEQEKAMKDKIEALRGQMEQQCRKYTEDIAKYKAHISDLSSRYWDVGEKLLAETQEKQAALHQLQQLKGQQQGAIAEASQQVAVAQSRQLSKTASLDRRDFGADRAAKENAARSGYRAVEVIEEETTTFSTRRHSVKSIQAMGNAFKAEDEEGEVFDSVYLADLKEGRCAPMGPDFDRLSELRMRNSMCRPHLRSSYAVETNIQPITLNEDDIKNGVTGDDVFNDSLSQSLLPGQKPKKKDRTQTSYKRPGPPTPSKNGGRLSLQGNELKSPGSRILRERNVERRTTATPRGLKNLFGTSISKRQDENVAGGTPKGRRLSNIFRKQRTERN